MFRMEAAATTTPHCNVRVKCAIRQNQQVTLPDVKATSCGCYGSIRTELTGVDLDLCAMSKRSASTNVSIKETMGHLASARAIVGFVHEAAIEVVSELASFDQVVLTPDDPEARRQASGTASVAILSKLAVQHLK